MARHPSVLAVCAVALLSNWAAADNLAKRGAGKRSTAKAGDDADKTATPPVTLEVEEYGPGLPWSWTITNTAKRSVTVNVDPRLLWFKVTVPRARKVYRKRDVRTCRLPSQLYPTSASRRFNIRLRPGKSYSQEFDPRLYCFAAGQQHTLVPGSVIHPRFGWPDKTKKRWVRGRLVTETLDEPPYVLKAAKKRHRGKGKGKGGHPAARNLTGSSFSLQSAYSAWSAVASPVVQKPQANASEDPEDPVAPQLTLSLGSDARHERTATVTLRLSNPHKKRSLRVYFRRELVTFEVLGPDGLVTCNSQPDVREPDRQAFLRLRPKRKMTITSRLVELCPRGTFDRPGLYLVNARFDANDAGRRFGFDAFTGRVTSARAVAVRIQTGKRPFSRPPRRRRWR